MVNSTTVAPYRLLLGIMEMNDQVNVIIRSLDTHSAVSVSQALKAVKAITVLTFEEKVALSKAFSDVFFQVHYASST